MSIKDFAAGHQRVIDAIASEEFCVLSICDVMDWLHCTFNIDAYSMSWDEECVYVKQFCENFDMYLYEKPRESFFPAEGMNIAQESGYRGVILSDLS